MTFDCARARTGAWAALRAGICALGVGLVVVLAGCSARTNVQNGTPATTVTGEAAGDFSSYVVGIYVSSLKRSDGLSVLPSNEGATEEYVDLTKRVDLTELLSAIGVPKGTYKSAVIRLDFSNANVYLKGQSKAAKVVDSSGANPGQVSITVTFDPSHPLVIKLNQSSRLAVDVDLAASNSVDASTNTVTVRPFAVASAEPYDTAPIRGRGAFAYVNAGKSNLTVNLRPFDDNVNSPVGALTINTSSSTYFDIDGTPYTGSAGITALAQQSNNAQLNANSTIVAYGSFGDLSHITPAINATEVYVGSSVSSLGAQEVRGIVTARSGNTLTVRNADLICPQYVSGSSLSTHFETATVKVGSSTKVTRDGTAASGLSAQSISVGQRIYATGQANITCAGKTGSTASLTLNATSGEVRLQPTTAWGTLVSGTTGSATVSLLQLGPYAASDFTFTGTGITSASDANPASYVIDTGTTDESGTASGTLLRADGIVTPFGSAPPDFTATSVTPGTSTPSSLIVEWSGGTASPFTTYGSSGLVVNLGNSGIKTAILRTGPQTTQLSSLPSSPTVLPGCQSGTCTGNAVYAIGNAANGISEFNGATAFLSDLSNTLNGSNKVFKLVAIGSYDSASNTFYTQRIDVALE